MNRTRSFAGSTVALNHESSEEKESLIARENLELVTDDKAAPIAAQFDMDRPHLENRVGSANDIGCQHCGAAVRPTFKYCNQCGNYVHSNSFSENPNNIFSLTPAQRKVMQSIAGLKGSVTPADVSAVSGLSLDESLAQLNLLARKYSGKISVSNKGEVVYSFNFLDWQHPNLRVLFEKAQIILALFLRVLFAVMLLFCPASIVLLPIACAIFIPATFICAALYDRNHRRKEPEPSTFLEREAKRLDSRDEFNPRKGLGFDILSIPNMFSFLAAIFDVIIYPATHSSFEKARQRSLSANLLSLVVGSAHENSGIEHEVWKSVARLIRKRNGVILAEQLPPYTGLDPGNDQAVIEAMMHFDGHPEVSDHGDIFYSFPSMQSSAIAETSTESSVIIREHTVPFANISNRGYLWIAGFISMNLWLYWRLLFHPATAVFARPFIIPYLAFPYFLLTFLMVPLLRFAHVHYTNRQIKKRNALREQYLQLCMNPTPELSNRLKEAQEQAEKMHRIKEDEIIYTTDKDLLEQEIERSKIDRQVL